MRFHRPSCVRRGVSSVLAMIFMAIVASLTAVMAIVAEGNVRGAQSAVQVSRALSAAESGLHLAAWRIGNESARYVIEAGEIEGGLGERLWRGTWVAADGAVTIGDPSGYTVATPTGQGLMHAIYDAHRVHDAHADVIEGGTVVSESIDAAAGTVESQGISVAGVATGPWFRVKYELLAAGDGVRVTSRGVDDGVERFIQMDFMFDKRIEYAMIGQNRIMVGKNVMIDGPIGALYGTVSGELDYTNGDPLVVESDFVGLDASLDTLLSTFQSVVAVSDVDGDGRLRPGHPTEGSALAANPSLQDHDGDQYVDEFDLFLGTFDGDSDDMVVFDSALAQAAGLGILTQEFSEDMEMASLIDLADADRNHDGLVDALDTAMGWNDGVLDNRDRYAKLRGQMSFAVTSADWETARGADWQTLVHATVRPAAFTAPASFGVAEPDLVSLTSDMFLTSTTWYETQAVSGASFSAQIASNGGWTPEYEYNEPVPWGSEAAYDLYDRPVYRNMTFQDVVIPMGTNALFEDCTFVGVTWVETTETCEDVNWNYVGSREFDGGGNPVLRFPELEATSGSTTYSDTTTVSNNLRFDDCTFLGTLGGDRPLEYTHWRNKIQLTGDTRFFIDPYDADLLAESDATTLQSTLLSLSQAERDELSRSSMMLPGWSVDMGNFDSDTSTKVKLNGIVVAGLIDIRGSASVHGTIMTTFRPVEGAGPLYYGGGTDVFNTTLGYFGISQGDMEGVDTSDPSFAGFGSISITYDPGARLPDGIPWPMVAMPDSTTWYEGGSW